MKAWAGCTPLAVLLAADRRDLLEAALAHPDAGLSLHSHVVADRPVADGDEVDDDNLSGGDEDPTAGGGDQGDGAAATGTDAGGDVSGKQQAGSLQAPTAPAASSAAADGAAGGGVVVDRHEPAPAKQSARQLFRHRRYIVDAANPGAHLLHVACAYDSIECARWLVGSRGVLAAPKVCRSERKLILGVKASKWHSFPLEVACKNGADRVAAFLADRSVDPLAVDSRHGADARASIALHRKRGTAKLERARPRVAAFERRRDELLAAIEEKGANDARDEQKQLVKVRQLLRTQLGHIEAGEALLDKAQQEEAALAQLPKVSLYSGCVAGALLAGKPDLARHLVDACGVPACNCWMRLPKAWMAACTGKVSAKYDEVRLPLAFVAAACPGGTELLTWLRDQHGIDVCAPAMLPDIRGRKPRAKPPPPVPVSPLCMALWAGQVEAARLLCASGPAWAQSIEQARALRERLERVVALGRGHYQQRPVVALRRDRLQRVLRVERLARLIETTHPYCCALRGGCLEAVDFAWQRMTGQAQQQPVAAGKEEPQRGEAAASGSVAAACPPSLPPNEAAAHAGAAATGASIGEEVVARPDVETVLSQAVMSRSWEVLQRVMEHHAPLTPSQVLSSVAPGGRSPLLQPGSADLVQRLLLSVGAPERDGWWEPFGRSGLRLLVTAAATGASDVCEVLVKQFGLAIQTGLPTELEAAALGFVEEAPKSRTQAVVDAVSRALLRGGGDQTQPEPGSQLARAVDSANDPLCNSPLLMAILKGHAGTAHLLMSLAEEDGVRLRGIQPRSLAAFGTRMGMDESQRPSTLRTSCPLCAAAARNMASVAVRLLDRHEGFGLGWQSHAPRDLGTHMQRAQGSPLSRCVGFHAVMAAAWGSSLSTLRALQARGADLRALAVQPSGVIKRGAPVPAPKRNQRGVWGMDAMSSAVASGCVSVAEYLVTEAGVDGSSAFWLATRRNLSGGVPMPLKSNLPCPTYIDGVLNLGSARYRLLPLLLRSASTHPLRESAATTTMTDQAIASAFPKSGIYLPSVTSVTQGRICTGSFLLVTGYDRASAAALGNVERLWIPRGLAIAMILAAQDTKRSRKRSEPNSGWHHCMAIFKKELNWTLRRRVVMWREGRRVLRRRSQRK